LVTRLVSVRLPESDFRSTVTPGITVLLASRTSAVTVTSLPAVPAEASVPESVVRVRVGTALITCTVTGADLAEPALAVMVMVRSEESPLTLSFSTTWPEVLVVRLVLVMVPELALKLTVSPAAHCRRHP
jgi:hypothetical protein